MPRHVAFLRGVSPTNARMPDVQRSFEAAGFTAVRTILASGNVAFDTPAADTPLVERRAEQALLAGLGRPFPVIVRTSAHLQRLLEDDPKFNAGKGISAGVAIGEGCLVVGEDQQSGRLLCFG